MSICNLTETPWNIRRITPCNDCNPKFFLEGVANGKEAKRVSELDVLYIVGKKPFFELPSDSCYVDSVDVGEYIEYDLKRGTTYRFWIEYQIWTPDEWADPMSSAPVWRERLVSDSLEFVH